MKKKYIIITMLVLLSISILIINKNQKRDMDFKEMFNRWDRGDLESTESIAMMGKFVNFLIENPEISNKDIQMFSPQIKVYEKDDFRIIEYIENPEFYGSSARGSYHIIMCDGILEMVDINGSIYLNEIIKVNDDLYYIYVTDYKFSNITGINVYSIAINEKNIEYKSIISKDDIANEFRFSDSLYYDDEHIFFEDIKNNGNEVMIKVKDRIYTLILEEDGLYHIIEDM